MSLTDIQAANHDWQVQKFCTDIDAYELIVEKQKTGSGCTQRRESWKWIISYHGSIVSSGSVNSSDEAMKQALANLPVSET